MASSSGAPRWRRASRASPRWTPRSPWSRRYARARSPTALRRCPSTVRPPSWRPPTRGVSAAQGTLRREAPAIATALVVAASLIGDTLLYTALPVSASSLGISRPVVGLILSLNRWVRLLTNPLAARLYGRFAAGTLVFAAILLTAVSTAMYALPAAL